METILPTDKPHIPANTGYYKIIVLRYGYLHPRNFVSRFYHHWDGKGWPQGGNKLSLMCSWMDKYVDDNPKSRPNLNETERMVLKAFLDVIEERLIVRLFNVLQAFEVTDKLIIFRVPEDKAQAFAAWLETLPLENLIQAYNREIKVRYQQ